MLTAFGVSLSKGKLHCGVLTYYIVGRYVHSFTDGRAAFAIGDNGWLTNLSTGYGEYYCNHEDRAQLTELSVDFRGILISDKQRIMINLVSDTLHGVARKQFLGFVAEELKRVCSYGRIPRDADVSAVVDRAFHTIST
jgi:hypothetical protein